MNKFDSVVMGALDIAQGEMLKRKNNELDALHLLWGLVNNKSSWSYKSLKKYKSEIESKLESLPTVKGEVSLDNVRPSGSFSKWVTLAGSHVAQEGRGEIAEKDLFKFMPQVFTNLKIDYTDLQNAEEEVEVPNFITNLSELAAKGKLDPVIGRTKEIRAVMEILGRRSKNNPVLVGPAGVGKTAIVEGLADKIFKGEVPDVLQGKTIYSVEMGALMAGTKYRGEFEERMQQLIKFVKSKAGEVILFIDEIHQLVGAGRTDGAMDAANLLKPALARGDLRCVGATTPEEYQKYILNDSALDRRFRSVPVNEPSKEDAIEIIMGIRDKLEMHHGVKISDEAVYQSVYLSDQYITDKNLPDKAIDLIDESASALKLSAEAMPAALVELQSEIRNKRILAQVEKDNKEIAGEIETLQKDFDVRKEAWEKEVLSLKKVSDVKNRLERMKHDLEIAERDQKYEEASKLKYYLIPELEKELEGHQHDWVLSPKNIAAIISRQTGIPEDKIMKTRQDYILKIEDFLNGRVYGQKEALHEISETLIASYAGLSSENRPLGSFMLLGPTGVGKTETAKALTQYLFDNEDHMIRMDLSEFSEKHSVAKLIGAPAGYVGYEEGGILTEAVRRKPYSVILFDEIEKAHPDFSDILLQILDDGRLTDNKGRTINFKNTIILMTSNSKDIYRDFKPEVLGRFDAILNFKPIDKGIMKELVDKQLRQLNERLKGKKLKVNFTTKAMETLCEQGHDPQFGARPLASVFQRLVTRPLSRMLLSGELPEGLITLDWNGQDMKLSKN